MSGLREMRKHLKSIRSIGQLAGAMRAVSTAKYSRLNNALANYEPYAKTCSEMLEHFGADGMFPHRETINRRCIVVLGSNRGLCGSYNSELLNHFTAIFEGQEQPIIIPCGRIAIQRCKDKGIPIYREFIFEDVPSFAQARELSQCLCKLYREGVADEIIVVFQDFKNILTQTPKEVTFLPCGGAGGEQEDYRTLYLPDREQVEVGLIPLCLDAWMYSLLLNAATGAQAATIMAMRSAFDNAQTSAAELEIKINRLRQTIVTSDELVSAGDRSD